MTNPEIHYAKTVDGWILGLRRYRPNKGKQISLNPVVLCHGLAANKMSVDFSEPGKKNWEKYSLAAYLSEGHNGEIAFDVWVPELRGRGLSQTYDSENHPEKYNWSIDEYIDLDIPAILTSIQKTYWKENKTQPKILWIGKSMGGMIIYAYGQKSISRKMLKAVVIMGSPMSFQNSSNLLKIITRLVPRKIAGPLHVLERLSEDSILTDMVLKNLASDGSIKEDVLDSYINEGLANTLSLKVFEHFASCIRHGTFTKFPEHPWWYDLFDFLSMRQKIPLLSNRFVPHNYSKNLWKFIHPLLVITGTKDQIADIEDVRYGYRHAGSVEKKMVVLEKGAKDSQGKVFCKNDYGHIDLNLGKHVHEEVYPIIYDWLSSQCKKQ